MEHWDRPQQLRHAAQYCFRVLQNGQRKDILELQRELNLLGYDGMVDSLTAEEIIHGWREAGWIKISPNGTELRLTAAGNEQFAQWQDEDAMWTQGASEEIKLAKRLKAGKPATNLRKIKQVVGNAALISVHDPYTTGETVDTLLKLKGIGVDISNNAPVNSPAKRRQSNGGDQSFHYRSEYGNVQPMGTPRLFQHVKTTSKIHGPAGQHDYHLRFVPEQDRQR